MSFVLLHVLITVPLVHLEAAGLVGPPLLLTEVHGACDWTYDRRSMQIAEHMCHDVNVSLMRTAVHAAYMQHLPSVTVIHATFMLIVPTHFVF